MSPVASVQHPGHHVHIGNGLLTLAGFHSAPNQEELVSYVVPLPINIFNRSYQPESYVIFPVTPGISIQVPYLPKKLTCRHWLRGVTGPMVPRVLEVLTEDHISIMDPLLKNPTCYRCHGQPFMGLICPEHGLGSFIDDRSSSVPGVALNCPFPVLSLSTTREVSAEVRLRNDREFVVPSPGIKILGQRNCLYLSEFDWCRARKTLAAFFSSGGIPGHDKNPIPEVYSFGPH